MKKSELIKVLQDSIASHGDDPIYHDLDAGDSIIEIEQFNHYDEKDIERIQGAEWAEGMNPGALVLL